MGFPWKNILVLLAFSAATAQPERRRITIQNDSGRGIAIDWVNPSNGDLIPMSASVIGSGSDVAFESFENHTFVVHDPSENLSECSMNGGAGACHVGYVVVGSSQEQVAIVSRDLQVVVSDPSEKPDILDAAHIGSDCLLRATSSLQQGKNSSEDLERLAACLEQKASAILHEKNEEIAFETEIRTTLSGKLENYTCADPTMETTTPIRVTEWNHQNKAREVGILHEWKSSKIHIIKNFISPEECDAITAAAKPKLHRGTVADGAGGSQLSDSRKAWQAGIRIPYEKEAGGNHIVDVFRRIYAYANDATGYNMTVQGQEDLMSIQYFGKGKSSEESPDQYRPHCDGQCDGLEHKYGGRVATMVMYCDAPELGGGTNFQNSGVFVKPEVGAAAFFSYMDAETNVTDKGFTSHSGCPVIEGTKRIAVHWMRIGVSEETPWDAYNTLTVKRDDEDC